MVDPVKMEAQLILHEGLRCRPYADTDEPPNWTLGVGYNVSARGLEAFDEAIGRTIAWEVGQPVAGDVVTEAESLKMLHLDIDRYQAAVKIHLPNYDTLSEVRQRVCVDFAFNMGLRALSFKKAIAAVALGDWSQAAKQMYASIAYKQEPARITRLAQMMLTNQDYTETHHAV